MINNSELKSTLFRVMPFVLEEDEYKIDTAENENTDEEPRLSLKNL